MQRLNEPSSPADPAAGAVGSAEQSGRVVSWTPGLRLLAAVVVLLAVLGLVIDLVDDLVPEADGPVRGALDILQRWFTLDAEATVPAWFTVSVLTLVAVALALIALCQRAAGGSAGRYWVMSAVALYLSVDEAASLHEEAGRITGQFVDGASIGTFSWVVPGALLALLVGGLLLRLARGLPARLRFRLVVAGAVYLAGALLVESLAGSVSNSAVCPGGSCADVNLPYLALTTVEESLEMTGAVLALRAALLQLQLHAGAAGLALGLVPLRSSDGGRPSRQDRVVADGRDRRTGGASDGRREGR